MVLAAAIQMNTMSKFVCDIFVYKRIRTFILTEFVLLQIINQTVDYY